MTSRSDGSSINGYCDLNPGYRQGRGSFYDHLVRDIFLSQRCDGKASGNILANRLAMVNPTMKTDSWLHDIRSPFRAFTKDFCRSCLQTAVLIRSRDILIRENPRARLNSTSTSILLKSNSFQRNI